MIPLVLYCKSYRTDLRRVVRLARSVQRFNVDALPFFVSVPAQDLALFKGELSGLQVQLLTDEDILSASPAISSEQMRGLNGVLAQQVIKSEFWRLGHSLNYLCIDSDSVFIRNFATSDFLAPDGVPYSVINEAHDLLELSEMRGKPQVTENFLKESAQVQQLFSRAGKAYSFGPMPLVWHRDVWQSLESEYLIPRGINFADAIQQAPMESRWYGEAHLRYRAVPLLPSEPFFKVYHYAWQFDTEKLPTDRLGKYYSGVIYQSSWEREMDWPAEGGGTMSRFGRRLRRRLGRI